MAFTVTYDSLHEYILEHNLTENDSLVLHPQDYDDVAKDYISENNFMMYRPVEILGIRVLEDTEKEVRRNQVAVISLAS